MPRPLFQLGPRLALCAALVRPGVPVADIGTDHGYLPIWLLKTGKSPRAVAADINPGPLRSAEKNGLRYGVGGELRFVLSDGLQGLGPQDAEDIVMAGMGGELILRIIGDTPWLRDPSKRLALQPMSCAPQLREGLWRLGFAILEEHACLDSGKVYSAFSVQFTGEMGPMPPLYPYMGKLAPGGPAVREYAGKALRALQNQLQGAEHQQDKEAAAGLRAAIAGIEEEYSRTGGT